MDGKSEVSVTERWITARGLCLTCVVLIFALGAAWALLQTYVRPIPAWFPITTAQFSLLVLGIIFWVRPEGAVKMIRDLAPQAFMPAPPSAPGPPPTPVPYQRP